MCACKFKIGSKSSLEGTYPVLVSAQGIADNRTREVMLCIYHTSPSKFHNAFKNITGDVKSDNDVIALADAHDKGQDLSSFKKDFLTIVRELSKTFTQAELDNASCTIGLYY